MAVVVLLTEFVKTTWIVTVSEVVVVVVAAFEVVDEVVKVVADDGATLFPGVVVAVVMVARFEESSVAVEGRHDADSALEPVADCLRDVVVEGLVS